MANNIYEAGNDFVMLSRAYRVDLEEGSLTFDAYGLLMYLFQKANPVNGTIHGNVTTIAEGVGETSKKGKNRVEYLLKGLKENKYIEFDIKRGTRRNYPIKVNHYPLSRGGYSNISENEVQFSEVEEVIQKTDSPDLTQTAINSKEANNGTSEVSYTETKTETEKDTYKNTEKVNDVKDFSHRSRMEECWKALKKDEIADDLPN
jgi:hypothetical protein